MSEKIRVCNFRTPSPVLSHMMTDCLMAQPIGVNEISFGDKPTHGSKQPEVLGIFHLDFEELH